MIKSPPLGRDLAALKLWAADVYRVKEVTRHDVAAIADLEEAFSNESDSHSKGLLEAVLLYIQSLQADAWSIAAAPQAKDELPDVPDKQTAILCSLAEGPVEGRRPKKLAKDLDLSPEHTSRLLRRLVADGLVQKVPPTGDDKRASQYVITEDGRQALHLVKAEPSLAPARALEQMVNEGKRTAAHKLIVSQRDDRRAERAEATFVERPLLAARMAEEAACGTLYLDAMSEYLTSLRHRGWPQDRRAAAECLANLSKPITWMNREGDDQYRAAVVAYQSAKLEDFSDTYFRSRIGLAEDNLEKAGDSRGLDLGIWVANAQGVMELKVGRSESAQVYARRALDRALKADDWFAEVTVSARLGMILRMSGLAGTAVDFVDRALKRMDEVEAGSEYRLLRAECLYQRGEARRYQGGPKATEGASADLEKALELLALSQAAEGSRQLLFTHSAAAALAFDLARVKPASSSQKAIDRLSNILQQSDSDDDLDVRALTTRRLAVALAKDKPETSYRRASEAAEMYNDLSVVGRIESLVCAAVVSRKPSADLKAIPDLLEALSASAESPSATQTFRLLDVWVWKYLGRIDAESVISPIGLGLKKLQGKRLMSTPGADVGLSPMGKEPLVLRVVSS